MHLRKCKLVLERGDGTTAEYIFDQPAVTIGAMDDNDIVVDDDTVSRYHCKISQDDDAYLIQDLGSTNGTFVNRVRIREAFLKPGCMLTVGKTESASRASTSASRSRPPTATASAASSAPACA